MNRLLLTLLFVLLSATASMAEGVLKAPANSTLPSGQFTYSAPVAVDTQVKATGGFLHCIMISQNDAAPTAGSINIFDDPAETGTKVFSWTLTTAVFVPFQYCPDVILNSGLYIGFTTTADVNVSTSYR